MLILVRHCGYAAHALQDVEHETLRLQKALHLSLDAHHDVAGLDVRSVLDVGLDLQVRVESMKHFLCNLVACKDAFLLDEEFAFAHLGFRDATKCRVVSVADVLGK